MSDQRSAQWRAFDKVLHWVNEQTEQMINKKHLYRAVMEMRPEEIEKGNLMPCPKCGSTHVWGTDGDSTVWGCQKCDWYSNQEKDMHKPTKTPEPPPMLKPPVPLLTVEQIALLKAADWFDAYAHGHLQKPNGADKAERNRKRAMLCRLVAQPGPHTKVVLMEDTGLLCGISTITGDLMWGPVE